MNKAYTRIDWENEPSTNTPINETNLNKMDSALDELDNRVIAQDTSKADKTEVSTLIANVEFDESTGIITVTRKNGSVITIDTKMEKIAVNFDYDPVTQQIILTLVDGTKQYIDLSALITQYEFLDSDTITFVVQADGSIKAEVLDGSITENKLQSNYMAQIKVETAKSETYMNNASSSATQAKSYAVGGTGTREGEDTDNAKYYYHQAKSTDVGQLRQDVEQIEKDLSTHVGGEITEIENDNFSIGSKSRIEISGNVVHVIIYLIRKKNSEGKSCYVAKLPIKPFGGDVLMNGITYGTNDSISYMYASVFDNGSVYISNTGEISQYAILDATFLI